MGGTQSCGCSPSGGVALLAEGRGGHAHLGVGSGGSTPGSASGLGPPPGEVGEAED